MSTRSGSDKNPLPILESDRAEEAEFSQSRPDRILGLLAGLLTIAAVLAGAVLLLSDAAPMLASFFKTLVVLAPRALAWFSHAPLSALPLLLAGASYVALQAVLRPPPMALLRRLMLGSAFLLWGVVSSCRRAC